MLCQACEKNETDEAVICESCQGHYAAIREGRYAEHALTQGESQLVVRSWTALGAPPERNARREEKHAKRGGLFRKAPPPPPEEPPPPPDWKNRVFPEPDPTPEPEPVFEAAPPQDEFSYGYHEAAPSEPEPTAIEADEPAPRVYDLTPSVELEAPEPAPPVLEVNEPAIAAVEPAVAFEAAPVEPPEASVPIAIEPMAVEPLAPVETPPALSNFLESLAAPAAPAASVEPQAPTPAALADFLGSLSTPSAPEVAAAPVTPAAPASLANFLEGLASPATPAEPTPPVTPAAPAALASFFESLERPAEPAPAAAAEPVIAEPAPSVPAPLVPQPVAPIAGAPEPLADFFEVIASEGAADFLAALGPETGTPNDFFAAVPPAPETPVVPPKPDAAPVTEVRGTVEGRKPFSIELPEAPASQPEPARPAAAKPPALGTPFTIELTPPEPPSVPRGPRPSDEIKQKHSTGGLAFVSDDEEEEAQGLLDGLAFYDAHDDDDDRTIEL